MLHDERSVAQKNKKENNTAERHFEEDSNIFYGKIINTCLLKKTETFLTIYIL